MTSERKSLREFRDAHRGGSIVVCGCGSSLTGLARPERFTTIGVNDVGRLFHPTYLVVVDPREQLGPVRYDHVRASQAGHVFTQRTDLDLPHSRVVPFRLGRRDGTEFSDPDALDYSVTTPYVALCLAVHMGAARVGLVGIDFTDHHFFGPTGRHAWAAQVGTIDAQFDRLCRAALARGVRVFNLSPGSRLTCVPKMAVETFAEMEAAPASPTLRIVSYATTPLSGVPAILARCINARTGHSARCVWPSGTYTTGITFPGDLAWPAAPGRAMAELETADLVIVHNGRVAAGHAPALEGKPVLTLAHNEPPNLERGFVDRGLPGLAMAQHLPTLADFVGWAAVPNPIPLWEDDYRRAVKPEQVTIAYTPPSRHEAFPPGHALHWHGKGHVTTLAVLDRLAARHSIRLAVLREEFVPHAQAMALKRGAHILIDECVTGSYGRNSLEGLAAACVVVNGVGLVPGVETALLACAQPGADTPFVSTGLIGLEDTLEALIALGAPALEAMGAQNRAWLERNWAFEAQWDRFWVPAIAAAMTGPPARKPTRKPRPTGVEPALSVVVAARNEGEMLRRTVESLWAGLPENGEIVVVDDRSTDGSCALLARHARLHVVDAPGPLGAAGARNFGARHARGEIVLFSDAHVAVPRCWAPPLLAALADPAVGAVGPAMRAMAFPQDYEPEAEQRSAAARGFGIMWSGPDLGNTWLGRQSSGPHAVPLLGGAFLAMRRNVFAAMGGFDGGFDTWGSEDQEICIRLWTLGFKCLVVPEVDVAHLFRSSRPYAVDWTTVIHNKLRLARLHFNERRRAQVTAALVANPAFPAALARVESSNANARRLELDGVRCRDDDGFFAAFAGVSCPGLGSLQESERFVC